jgi:aminopeptidase YwaD
MSTLENRLMDHLSMLSHEIGCRPVGTAENTAAADYIKKILNDIGAEVEDQEFEVPAWEFAEAFLEINNERLEVTANTFSVPCEILGDLVPFCTLEELESASDLKGKIALLYGELSKENYVPKGFTIYNPEHHKKAIGLLESKNPSAIITIRMQKGKQLPLLSDWDFSIPSVTVTPETGLSIKEASTAKLVIKSKSSLGTTRNIIGRIAGARKEKIILAAHYDTVFNTNGAFDNASGISVMLTIAEVIAKRKTWATSFEFIAFSSEEYLGLGDEVYLQHYKESLPNALAAMNFDGVGQSLGTNNITLMSGSKELQARLKAIKNDFPAVHWTNPWYESNHYTFFSNGVPSIPFSCGGVSDLLHTADDTIQWISPDKLAEVFSIAWNVLIELEDKTVVWTRGSGS